MTFKVKKNEVKPEHKIKRVAGSFEYNDSIKLSWGKAILSGTDSFSKNTLLKSDSLYLTRPGYSCDITLYRMEIIADGKSQACYSISSSITIAMRKRITDLKPGSTILIKEITYTRRAAVPDLLPSIDETKNDIISNAVFKLAHTVPFRIYLTE